MSKLGAKTELAQLRSELAAAQSELSELRSELDSDACANMSVEERECDIHNCRWWTNTTTKCPACEAEAQLAARDVEVARLRGLFVELERNINLYTMDDVSRVVSTALANNKQNAPHL